MVELELPVKLFPLDSVRGAIISRDFPNFNDTFLRGEPGGILMHKSFWDEAKKIYNMKVRPDDVWLVTFPKSGTTWTQEMIWLIVNNCDFEGAKQPLLTRFPFLELLAGINAPEHEQIRKNLPTVEDIERMPSPRLIKTHLPLCLLPPAILHVAKVVYVARNPKDVSTSYFFHHKFFKIQQYNGTLEQFVDHFLRDEITYSSYFNHVLGAWEVRDHPNMCFMFYEDMKRDLRREIEKLARFLSKSLTEEQTNDLLEHLSFKNFKENPAVNCEPIKVTGFVNSEGHFIRKGETGDWRNHFSDRMNDRFDKWISHNLASSSLTFALQL